MSKCSKQADGVQVDYYASSATLKARHPGVVEDFNGTIAGVSHLETANFIGELDYRLSA